MDSVECELQVHGSTRQNGTARRNTRQIREQMTTTRGGMEHLLKHLSTRLALDRLEIVVGDGIKA
jgi:hypothetical protein